MSDSRIFDFTTRLVNRLGSCSRGLYILVVETTNKHVSKHYIGNIISDSEKIYDRIMRLTKWEGPSGYFSSMARHGYSEKMTLVQGCKL